LYHSSGTGSWNGAAETRLFRLRAFNPSVTVTPVVIALNTSKNDANIASSNAEAPLRPREKNDQSFTVFPNPATESATLRFPAREEGENHKLTIADMYGNVISEMEVQSDNLVLPTRLLPSGVYVCSVQGNKRVWNTLLHVVK
jgi:hypothetical protein